MTLGFWIDYLIINLAAAVAIALDACILVLLKFRHMSSAYDAAKWASAVGLTHIAFPMIGFVGGWWLIQEFHLSLVVYPIGAVLLAILLRLIIHEAITTEQDHHTANNCLISRNSAVYAFWIPVIYVSLDALLSGPGKTVILERYPATFAWLSFLLVGVLVGVFTLIAGWISYGLHQRWMRGTFDSPLPLAKAATRGIIAEILLFTFFMFWCVTKSIDQISYTGMTRTPLWLVASISLIGGGGLIAKCYRSIWSAQLSHAQAVIDSRVTID